MVFSRMFTATGPHRCSNSVPDRVWVVSLICPKRGREFLPAYDGSLMERATAWWWWWWCVILCPPGTGGDLVTTQWRPLPVVITTTYYFQCTTCLRLLKVRRPLTEEYRFQSALATKSCQLSFSSQIDRSPPSHCPSKQTDPCRPIIPIIPIQRGSIVERTTSTNKP